VKQLAYHSSLNCTTVETVNYDISYKCWKILFKLTDASFETHSSGAVVLQNSLTEHSVKSLNAALQDGRDALQYEYIFTITGIFVEMKLFSSVNS